MEKYINSNLLMYILRFKMVGIVDNIFFQNLFVELELSMVFSQCLRARGDCHLDHRR